MSEATETTEETTSETDQAGDQTATTTENKKKAPAPTQSRNGDNSLLLDKVSALEADLRRERTTIKSLRTERDGLATQVGTFQLKDKKSTALSKALTEIGEDFEITAEKSAELHELVGELQDSEELEVKIGKFVNLVRTPKNKAGIKITTPTMPASQQTSNTAATQTPDQLFELARTNPEAFKAAVVGR